MTAQNLSQCCKVKKNREIFLSHSRRKCLHSRYQFSGDFPPISHDFPANFLHFFSCIIISAYIFCTFFSKASNADPLIRSTRKRCGGRGPGGLAPRRNLSVGARLAPFTENASTGLLAQWPGRGLRPIVGGSIFFL